MTPSDRHDFKVMDFTWWCFLMIITFLISGATLLAGAFTVWAFKIFWRVLWQ